MRTGRYGRPRGGHGAYHHPGPGDDWFTPGDDQPGYDNNLVPDNVHSRDHFMGPRTDVDYDGGSGPDHQPGWGLSLIHI